MKLMIASDIHGSLYYCSRMLEAYEREGADKLLLLGDLLYHGPRNDLPRDYSPKGVLALLNERKNALFCVRGNCDADVDQMVLHFPILADYALLFLEGCTMFVTHGHVHNEDNLPPLAPGDILVHGHTHIPVLAKHNGIVLLNPGSVSLPKEGSAHSYMIYEDGAFTLKDLESSAMQTISIV